MVQLVNSPHKYALGWFAGMATSFIAATGAFKPSDLHSVFFLLPGLTRIFIGALIGNFLVWLYFVYKKKTKPKQAKWLIIFHFVAVISNFVLWVSFVSYVYLTHFEPVKSITISLLMFSLGLTLGLIATLVPAYLSRLPKG